MIFIIMTLMMMMMMMNRVNLICHLQGDKHRTPVTLYQTLFREGKSITFMKVLIVFIEDVMV